MNLEKLKRLQSQVRIGGKGTPRRKKKVIHQTAAADDKKLQSSLKKLSVNTIPGIEEVNIIKDDLTVIHFKNPKAQASLSANTFAVTGHGETKKIVEMLPEILPQLGQETVVQLRMFANSMTNNQRTGPVGDLAGSSLIGTTDDDDVPQLVNDFDEIANREEITKTEIKPKIETPANVTVSKVEAANGEMNKPQQNVSTKGTASTGSNMEASIPMPDAILKTSEVVKGEDKVQKELRSSVNKTESSAPKEIGGNKELSDKQKNKKNVEKGPAQEKHSKSPPKDKKPIGEKPDMNQEKNNQKPSAQKQKPEMKKEEIPKASDDSVQPADKAAKVPDAKKPEVTPSPPQVKPAPGAEIAPATPSPAAPTTMLLSQVIKNQMPTPQSEKPPAENRKQPEVAKELPKGPASNHTAIQAEQPKLEEPLVKKDSVKEESTPKPMENIKKPEHAAVTVQSADEDQQMKAVPLPAESKTESLSANQQNEPKKEIVPIIPSRIDVAKAMEPVKPIAPETLLATSVPEEKKAPCDDKTQAAPAQAQTTTDTVSKEIGKLDKDKAMELKAQQKQGATKKEPAKQQQQLQAKQSCPSPPATKTLPDSKKPEVAPKPKQVPVSPKPQAQQASTPPNAAPKSQAAPAKSPTGSIKSQEKQAVAPKPKPTATAPPKPRATTPPTKPTTAPAKKKSMSPPGTKKPTTDASANNNAKEPVKKAQGSPEETKAQPNPEGTKAQGGVEQTVGSPAASTKKISTESPAKIKSESVTKAPGSTEQTAGGAEKPKKTSETKNSATKAATKVQGSAEPAAKPRPEISSPKPKPAKSPAPKTAPSSKPSPPKAPEDPSKKPPQ